MDVSLPLIFLMPIGVPKYIIKLVYLYVITVLI